ncbi:hypothetical protein [Streptomyces sp. NPDC096012]|uniref:hypothetical protein n=1 Tax=Streptomyces sp. NPDC096012 TaxID=3155684 RepID=UPI00336AD317
MNARTVHTVHPSPLGDLLPTAAVTPAGHILTSLSPPGRRGAPDVRAEDRDDRPFTAAHRRLDAYFAVRGAVMRPRPGHRKAPRCGSLPSVQTSSRLMRSAPFASPG